MGILVECPVCKIRSGLKRKICKCGNKVQKADSKNYWIEYYLDSKRIRERIGRSKQAAENRLREVQTAKAEGRHIKKNKNETVTIGALRDWYLDLSEVKQRRSFSSIKKCLRICVAGIGDIPVSQLTLNRLEKFRKQRLTEISARKGRPVKPSTINRDVANLRAMLNKALDHSKIESNLIGRMKQLEENNVRQRVLSSEEFESLYLHCPPSLKGIVLMGFYLPMRQAEILNLTWKEIDLKMGFISLGGERTKNKTGRVVPLHPRIIKFLRTCPRPIDGGYVFGDSRRFNRKAYNKAVKAAGIVDFTNHDLRHCAINNMRLAGNDQFVIKQASGAKTDSVFQRYNFVSEEEMKGIKWLDEKSVNSGTMDTYMDTKAKTRIV
jgi:integrase